MNTVAPGFIETTAAQGLIARLAKNDGIDEGAARERLMDFAWRNSDRPARTP